MLRTRRSPANMQFRLRYGDALAVPLQDHGPIGKRVDKRLCKILLPNWHRQFTVNLTIATRQPVAVEPDCLLPAPQAFGVYETLRACEWAPISRCRNWGFWANVHTQQNFST